MEDVREKLKREIELRRTFDPSLLGTVRVGFEAELIKLLLEINSKLDKILSKIEELEKEIRGRR